MTSPLSVALGSKYLIRQWLNYWVEWRVVLVFFVCFFSEAEEAGPQCFGVKLAAAAWPQWSMD